MLLQSHVVNQKVWHRKLKRKAYDKLLKRTYASRIKNPSYKASLYRSIKKYQKTKKYKEFQEKQQLKRHKLREELFKKYGKVCNKCGFNDSRALQLDHKNGGGWKETISLSRQGVYKKALNDKNGNYQILCANCNWIKRIEKKEFNLRGK